VRLPNCLEALLLQVAAFRIGAIDMPVIPIYREHEVRQIVAESRPAVAAAAAELGTRQPAGELDGIFAELGHEPAVRYVVGGERPGWYPVPAPGGVAETELPEPLPADEPALLLYTSGTTSAPKGALLSSAALFAHMRNFKVALDVAEDCVILCMAACRARWDPAVSPAPGLTGPDGSPPAQAADRVADILDTAIRLFAARGYEAVSLDDIGAGLGMAGPSLYHYYATNRHPRGRLHPRRRMAGCATQTRRAAAFHGKSRC
jgi:hypothetical protein